MKNFLMEGEIIMIINDYKSFFENINKFGDKIVLYGAGDYGKRTFDIFKNIEVDITAFCDSDISKTKKLFCNKKVIPVNEVNKYRDYMFIVCLKNNEVREAVAEQLESLGIEIIVNILITDIKASFLFDKYSETELNNLISN